MSRLKSFVVSFKFSFELPSDVYFNFIYFISLGNLTSLMSCENEVVRDNITSSLTTGFQPYRSGKSQEPQKHNIVRFGGLDLKTHFEDTGVYIVSSLIIYLYLWAQHECGVDCIK
jgi:hypothetical protein